MKASRKDREKVGKKFRQQPEWIRSHETFIAGVIKYIYVPAFAHWFLWQKDCKLGSRNKSLK